VQRGGAAQLHELLAGDVQPCGDPADELGDALEVIAVLGVALGQHAQQHIAALASGGRAAGVLLRVHRLVGFAHRFAGVAGVLRNEDGPECRRDAKPLAAI
jgi:hypothetical protein